MHNTTIKLQLDTGNLWRVITFTRSSQMLLPTWKFKKVTQRSKSNLVEILMSRTSLPVQLQHDAGKIWCIIIFTRNCKMLSFEHDLLQKVRQRSTSNSCVKLQKDTGNSCSYRVHKAAWPLATLNIHIKLQQEEFFTRQPRLRLRAKNHSTFMHKSSIFKW